MKTIKKRKKFETLMKQKDNNKISLLLGPRQVGKTTLLKSIYNNLGESSVFLDLDVFSNFEKASSYENLINFLKTKGYSETQQDHFYVFLDEFQRYDDLSMVMKNVYDNHDNIKIYASGSSSLQIKDKVQESLAGRKIITYLYPLDFEEFLWFKDKEMPAVTELAGEVLDKATGELRKLLEEFMIYGGYPEVVLGSDKKTALESIFDLYVKKELVEYLKVDKVLKVKKLIEYLAINNGQKIKFEEVAEVSQLNYQSTRDYIEILTETFILNVVRPFFTNKNKELVKIPKIYFVDNGVRNYFINNFNKPGLRNDAGFLFEGFVVSEMIKAGCTEIKFWQNKNNKEVDIVIDRVSRQIPVEVKYRNNLKSGDFSGLNIFQDEYTVGRGYIVNTGVQKNIGKIEAVLPYILSKTINFK